MFILFTSITLFACYSDNRSTEKLFEEDIEADDIPIPSENIEDQITEEEEQEFEEAEAITIEYSFDDADSLLYVQVWKDESAAASSFAHNHVIRAVNWDGVVTYNKDKIEECSLNFSLPVTDLAVDEDAMRAFVGYDDTISANDRAEIRSHMLADNQLNAANYSSITFESTGCEHPDAETLRVSGDMTIAGATRNLTIDLAYTALLNNFYLSGEINFNHSDFNITPYSAFLGAVRNAEPLRITMDMVGTAL